MIVQFNGIGQSMKGLALPLFRPGKGWWTVDSLDSVWLGMKLGVAMIGMVMMLFLLRGIWRSKRAGLHKDR